MISDYEDIIFKQIFVKSQHPVPYLAENPPAFETSYFSGFKRFFNFIYFMGLAPFKLNSKSGEKSYEENILQKVVCLLIHTACLVYNAARVLSTVSRSVIKQPIYIFLIATTICSTAVNVSFVKAVWLSKEKISKFLQPKTPTTTFCNATFKQYAIFGFIFGYALAITIVDIIVESCELFLESSSTEDIWISLNIRFQNTLNPSFNLTNFLDDVNLQGKVQFVSDMNKTLVVVAFGLSLLDMIVRICGEILFSLVVVAVYQILGNRMKILKEMKAQKNQELVQFYLDTERVINEMNDLMGSITLAVYAIMLAVFTEGFLFAIVNERLPINVRVFFIMYTLYSLGLMILASISYNKGCDFRKLFLFKTEKLASESRARNEHLSRSFMTYFQITEGNLGVRGGDFFTFSFGFLGVTLCFSLTFLLVLMQLFKPTELHK